MKTAQDYLDAAAAEMRDRAASRDLPDGERSMAAAVAAFNVLYGLGMTETQGWEFMSLLKKARGSRGQYREDDYTDDVAYAALAAESEARVHTGRPAAEVTAIPESVEGGLRHLRDAGATADALMQQLVGIQRGTCRIAPITEPQMALQVAVNRAVNDLWGVQAHIDVALHATHAAREVA